MPIPTPNQVMRAREAQRKAKAKEKPRRYVWSLPDDHPQSIRRKARRRAAGDRRAANYKKLAEGLDKVPILGQTAFAPMSGFLKGAVKTYEAYKSGDNETIVAVAKEAGKEIKKMKDESKK